MAKCFEFYRQSRADSKPINSNKMELKLAYWVKLDKYFRTIFINVKYADRGSLSVMIFIFLISHKTMLAAPV
jgi:hypothetical protein